MSSKHRPLVLTVLLVAITIGLVAWTVQDLRLVGRDLKLDVPAVRVRYDPRLGRDDARDGLAASSPAAPSQPVPGRPGSPDALLARCYGQVPPLPVGKSQEEQVFDVLKGGLRTTTDIVVGMSGPPPSPAEERALTRQIAAQIRRKHPPGGSPADRTRIERIFQALLAQAPKAPPMSVTLVGSPKVNAFVVPGGDVYVFAGLLRAMPGDPELAFVLAHEIGHQLLGHTSQTLEVAVAGRRWGSILEAATQGGGTGGLGGQAGEQLAVITNRVLSTTYDQDHEFEADRFGQCLSTQATYAPQGGERAMATLERITGGRRRAAPTEGAGRVAYDIATTHPPGPERQRYLGELRGRLR